MKVLQVTNAESPFFESQLTALETVGIESTVSAPPTGIDGNRGPLDYLRWLPELRSLGHDDFDIVHANYGLTGPFALAQSTRPLVLSLWGSDVMGYSSVLDAVSQFAADRADAVIAPSRALQDELDVDSTLLPFGLDLDLLQPMDRQATRERVGWPMDETIALFPYDTSRAVKNYDRAEKVVEAAESDVTLRTVSGVTYEEMPDYLNASDLLLVTSDREAGPMVVKEAAACNVPVVSTDVGFARNVLEEVDNSYVTDSDEELADAIDRVVAANGRSNGRQSDAVISIEEMGKRLELIYEDATTASRGVRD